MEWKIGEIFEYNGEWYQCVERLSWGVHCNGCEFIGRICSKLNPKCSPSHNRSDGKSVIFKKLEKVGEPFYSGFYYSWIQKYKLYNNYATGGHPKCYFGSDYVLIEIKQNKEDMEENKTTLPKENNALTRIIYAYVNGKISDKELIKSIKEISDEYPYDRNNLKPFSLEEAKAGKPVCTRDGKPVRIICFDKRSDTPIIALVDDGEVELNLNFREDGHFGKGNDENPCDLMMLTEKKEYWINIYKYNKYRSFECSSVLYNTKEEAINHADKGETYVATAKVEWY